MRTGGRLLRVAWVVVALVIVTACSPVITGDPTGHIRLGNETTTAVAVHVNGGWAGTYPAGAVVDVPIRGHGGPPFAIEIRSPSGAVLASVTFSASDVEGVRSGGGSATGSAVDCGWIDIGYGITDFAPPEGDGAVRPPAAGICP